MSYEKIPLLTPQMIERATAEYMAGRVCNTMDDAAASVDCAYDLTKDSLIIRVRQKDKFYHTAAPMIELALSLDDFNQRYVIPLVSKIQSDAAPH